MFTAPAKPLSWYRQRAPLQWSFSSDTKVYLYIVMEQIHIDFLRTGLQKDQVISLTPACFITLYHIMSMVSAAVRKNLVFNYNIGSQVRVTYAEFRKRWTVGIRQMYVNEMGEEAPGRYGINIQPEDWRKASRSVMKHICKYTLFICKRCIKYYKSCLIKFRINIIMIYYK